MAVWTARLVTLAAFWSLISIVINGAWAEWIDEIFGLVNLPTDASLFTVVLLFVLGNALSRRIRFALWIVIFVFQLFAFLLGLLLAIYLLSGQIGEITINGTSDRVRLGLTVFEGVTGLVLGILLWKARSAFPARLGRGSRLRALLVFVGGLIVSALVAIGLTAAFPNNLEPGWERIGWALRAAIGQLPPPNSTVFHGHHGPHWIAVIAGIISAAALILATIVFFRSARAKEFVSPQDELEIRRLVLETGERDSLAYFATRRDKSVIFSPDGRAAVTYRVVARSEPGQRRSGRPHELVVRRDRRVDRRGSQVRLVPGRPIGERGGRFRLCRGRIEGNGDRRRGRHRGRVVLARRSDDGAGAPAPSSGSDGPVTP